MTADALRPQLGRALATLSAAALIDAAIHAHDATCRTCRTEQCPTARHLEAAAAGDLTLTPAYRSGP